jgi:allantoin racemase
MRILLINPNSTSSMTTHVAESLRLCLDKSVEIIQRTATQGPAVIATSQAFDDGALTACEMLRQAMAEGIIFDKVLLACFGDPGLEAMRELTNKPVIGLANSAMLAAELLGRPYAIVTAGVAWESILMQRFNDWQASSLFCGVYVLNGTGLDVFNNPVAAIPTVQIAIAEARKNDAEQIILGGAVFAGYGALMQQHDVDTNGVLDCVESAAVEITATAKNLSHP